MPKDQRKIIAEIPTNRVPGVNEIIRVSIFYDKGGYSYFTSKMNERGYYLLVKLMTVGSSGGGFHTESYSLFSGGYKHLLQPAARFNQKILDNLAPPQEVVDGMVNRILAEAMAKKNPGYAYTTQAQVRAYFWQTHPEYAGYRNRAGVYHARIREDFEMFIEALSRDQAISENLAGRVTL